MGTRQRMTSVRLRELLLALPAPAGFQDGIAFLSSGGVTQHVWEAECGRLKTLGLGYNDVGKALADCRGKAGDRSESARKWSEGFLSWTDLMDELSSRLTEQLSEMGGRKKCPWQPCEAWLEIPAEVLHAAPISNSTGIEHWTKLSCPGCNRPVRVARSESGPVVWRGTTDLTVD
jgi:hypothetical protein